MDQSVLLIGTAAALGIGHTLVGPDHYLPFISISAARRWSARRTAAVTIICGAAHVLSSILIGFAGILLGRAAGSLEAFESARGEIAAWAMISFGAVYAVWGLRRAFRRMQGTESGDKRSLVPFLLFVVFVLGPCEPLIPLLIFPAVSHGVLLAAAVCATFLVSTVATMTAMVIGVSHGLKLPSKLGGMRFSHAVAGLVIMCGGLAVQFLGL